MEGAGNSVPCRGIRGRAPNVALAHAAAAHKRNAQCSREARTSWRGGMEQFASRIFIPSPDLSELIIAVAFDCRRVDFGTVLCAVREFRSFHAGDVRSPATPSARPCFFYVLRRSGASLAVISPNPGRKPDAPCIPVSSSALRANIARFFYALRHMGLRLR